MRRTVSAAIALTAAITIAGCSSSSGDDEPASKSSTSTSSLNTPSPAPAAAGTTVRLAWSHTAKDDTGDTEVSYVARVTNPGKGAASVALDVRAVDKSGTIVGSSQETLPNIPHGSFDFFGSLGGGFTELTGTPAKIEVSQAKDAFGMAGAVEQPMLKTSELKLTQGSRDDLFSDASHSYSLSVKVTNSTRDDIKGGVTQQVVLYDAGGDIVGGDSGSSDNVPDTFPAGMSYREQWTGIPALSKARRAVYTVWPG